MHKITTFIWKKLPIAAELTDVGNEFEMGVVGT